MSCSEIRWWETASCPMEELLSVSRGDRALSHPTGSGQVPTTTIAIITTTTTATATITIIITITNPFCAPRALRVPCPTWLGWKPWSGVPCSWGVWDLLFPLVGRHCWGTVWWWVAVWAPTLLPWGASAHCQAQEWGFTWLFLSAVQCAD